jgi:hypothetical protein
VDIGLSLILWTFNVFAGRGGLFTFWLVVG